MISKKVLLFILAGIVIMLVIMAGCDRQPAPTNSTASFSGESTTTTVSTSGSSSSTTTTVPAVTTSTTLGGDSDNVADDPFAPDMGAAATSSVASVTSKTDNATSTTAKTTISVTMDAENTISTTSTTRDEYSKRY